MDDPLLQGQTPAEYFKDLVESAVVRQHLRVNELTSYYLVDLLCRFVRPDRRIPFYEDTSEPLALRLAKALESGGMEQRARLRNLGDFSLFTSGFFSLTFGPSGTWPARHPCRTSGRVAADKVRCGTRPKHTSGPRRASPNLERRPDDGYAAATSCPSRIRAGSS